MTTNEKIARLEKWLQDSPQKTIRFYDTSDQIVVVPEYITLEDVTMILQSLGHLKINGGLEAGDQ